MDGPTASYARAERDIRSIGRAFTVLASAARTVDSNTTFAGGWKRLFVLLDVTATASNANDKLDVYVDFSPDGGTTWLNAAHFTQIDGLGAATKRWVVLDPSNPGVDEFNVTSDAIEAKVRPYVMGNQGRIRVDITDGGGDHSFTFSVKAFGQS